MNVPSSSQMQPNPQITFHYAFLATHNILFNTFFMGRYTSYNPRFKSKLIFLSVIYLPIYLRIFPNVLLKFLSLCFDYVSCLTGISLSMSLLFIKMNRPDSNPFFLWQLLFFFPFIFISWRLITLQYCNGFCHTLTWISHGVTCIPHPDPPSHLPLHPIPLGLPSAPALSTCLMHPTWAGDLFHPR